MRTKLISVICLIAICISVWQLAVYFLAYKEEEKINLQVQQEKIEHSYAALTAQYEEMKAWISIDGTKIDYPVMQSNDNAFYLNHDYKGNILRSGSIFMDYRNAPNFTNRHTILYGHDMRNDSMFGQLSNYANEEFATAHSTIEIMVGNEQLIYEVVYAYETTTEFYYIETQFTDQSYTEFLQNIQSRSLIRTSEQLSVNDQLLTLSTCQSDANNQDRFVVHAKLVERNEI